LSTLLMQAQRSRSTKSCSRFEITVSWHITAPTRFNTLYTVSGWMISRQLV
jgi:hypothetical protein